jgi:hypothetical protein
MVGFDPVVGVLLGVMHYVEQDLVDHPQQRSSQGHCCVDGSTRDFDPRSRPQRGGQRRLPVLLMTFRTLIWGQRRTREVTLWLNATVPPDDYPVD